MQLYFFWEKMSILQVSYVREFDSYRVKRSQMVTCDMIPSFVQCTLCTIYRLLNCDKKEGTKFSTIFNKSNFIHHVIILFCHLFSKYFQYIFRSSSSL